MAVETGQSDPSPEPIDQALRAAIAARGLTAAALGRAAGVDSGVVKRYLERKRGLTLATADKLAAALGLRLVAPHVGRGQLPQHLLRRRGAGSP
jgi:transcriptional regulator with XRE-family HTH domain